MIYIWRISSNVLYTNNALWYDENLKIIFMQYYGVLVNQFYKHVTLVLSIVFEVLQAMKRF